MGFGGPGGFLMDRKWLCDLDGRILSSNRPIFIDLSRFDGFFEFDIVFSDLMLLSADLLKVS